MRWRQQAVQIAKGVERAKDIQGLIAWVQGERRRDDAVDYL